MKEAASTTLVGTQQGEASAQQLFITPDEALAIVQAFQRIQRIERAYDIPCLPAAVDRTLRGVIGRAGLSALVA